MRGCCSKSFRCKTEGNRVDAEGSVDWYRLYLPLAFSSGNKYYRPQRYKPSYSEDGAKPTHII